MTDEEGALDLEAAHIRAMQLIAAGQTSQAAHICEKILKDQPNDPAALHALGLTHYMARRYGRAVEYMSQAIVIDGSNPQYLCNLGEALRRDHKLDAAKTTFEKALDIKPEYLLAHLGLANTFRDQKRRPEAIARYRLALALNPAFAEAYHYLGVMFAEQDRTSEAIAYLRKAVSLKPKYVEAHLVLSQALDADGQIEEAIESYRDLIRRSPNLTAAHNNLANLLKTKGDLDGAILHYKRAIEINPNNVQARYNLSRAGKAREEGLDAPELEEMLKSAKLEPIERSNVHFTLGKIYDDLERHAEAFEHFRLGNDFDERSMPFDTTGHAKSIDKMISVFSKNFFGRRQGFGCDSQTPIFILGMPRSGTTLLEQVLATHPKVYGAGELDQISNLVNAISAECPGAASYPECANDLDAMTACRLGDSYSNYVRRLGGGAQFVTDKMPGNFMHIGFISLFLPNAKIIHSRRNPLDTCLSCYFQHFTNPMPFSMSLESLGHYYRGYQRLMAHWEKVLPGKILTVDYEDMVQKHEETVRKVISFCGLDWDPKCLQFHETERAVKTASTWQVRQPLYQTSVGRWKHYEHQLEPLIKMLGSTSTLSHSAA